LLCIVALPTLKQKGALGLLNLLAQPSPRFVRSFEERNIVLWEVLLAEKKNLPFVEKRAALA